jgi:hypothetical protein
MTPEARAKAIAALEDRELKPPQLRLTPEEIEQLEAEKRALTDGFVKPRSDAGRISGEGTAIDAGPTLARPLKEVVESNIRTLEATDRLLAPARDRQAPRPLGDVDTDVLARLLTAAKESSKRAAALRHQAANAEADARETRQALDEYMDECGLR